MFSHKLFQTCSSTASRSLFARPTLVAQSTASWLGATQMRSMSAWAETDKILGVGDYPGRKKKAIQRTIAIRNMPSFGDEAPRAHLGIEERWRRLSQAALKQAEQTPPAHAYSGRSVSVENGKVSDAMRSLDGILARNRVRYYLRKAQRHEQRGEKLRRLASERWRKQFAAEVREKVQLVTKIRNRGA